MIRYILAFKIPPSPCGISCLCNDNGVSDEARARCEDEAAWGVARERTVDDTDRGDAA